MQKRRIQLQTGRIQLQTGRIQLQNRRIQLQTGRIQLQNRRIQLQTGRIQLQSRRIQLQKPVSRVTNRVEVIAKCCHDVQHSLAWKILHFVCNPLNLPRNVHINEQQLRKKTIPPWWGIEPQSPV